MGFGGVSGAQGRAPGSQRSHSLNSLKGGDVGIIGAYYSGAQGLVPGSPKKGFRVFRV